MSKTFRTNNLAMPIAALLLFTPMWSRGGQYVAPEDDLAVGFSFSYTTFDEFWSGPGGDNQGPTPGGEDVERLSYRAYLQYGLTDTTSFDFSFGIADVSAFEGVPGSVGDQTEFADFYLGLGWQPLREDTDGADLFLRVGGIIDGTYETGALSAPGDGASGGDVSLRASKTLTEFGLRGEFGFAYTWLLDDVPDSISIKAGPSMPLGDRFFVDASVNYFTSVEEGLDIGGPGFGSNRLDNPSDLRDLPLVEEEGLGGEVGISWIWADTYWRASVARIFDGRNIGQELTAGLYVGYAFHDLTPWR